MNGSMVSSSACRNNVHVDILVLLFSGDRGDSRDSLAGLQPQRQAEAPAEVTEHTKAQKSDNLDLIIWMEMLFCPDVLNKMAVSVF